MQIIKIKSYEAGTIIPACGLDQATDKFRHYFQMSLGDFHHSFDNPESPGRWLYYLLSTQRYLEARLKLLTDHLEYSQLQIKKLELSHHEKMADGSGKLSSAMHRELQEKLEKIETVVHLLQTISTRLKAPQEQVLKLKQIRVSKIEQFGQRYLQLRQQLAEALTSGGLSYFTKTTLNKLLAYLFEITHEEIFLQDKLDEQTINSKILSAVQPWIPTHYYEKVSEILTQGFFWKILACNRNIPIAVAVTPVIVLILQELDVFTSTHAVLIEHVNKMKQALGGIEKYYAQNLINCQVPAIIDDRIKDIYAPKDRFLSKAEIKPAF